MDLSAANAELAQRPTLPQENTVGLWEIRGVPGLKIDELEDVRGQDRRARGGAAGHPSRHPLPAGASPTDRLACVACLTLSLRLRLRFAATGS
jgi:hypothetical protein